MNVNVKNIYFVGIGGIGMSALAKYFVMKGVNVYGYDRTVSKRTKELENKGVKVQFDMSLDVCKKLKKENTIVIFTPAIKKTNVLLKYFVESDFNVLKRAEVLGEISKELYCVAISGTHGKTSISSVLTHILVSANIKVIAFLGGILKNEKSNFIYRGTDVMVVEADEYDKSFLQLYPNMICINSVDSDHLDIYGTSENLLNTFKKFGNKVSDIKNLLVNKTVPFGKNKYGIACMDCNHNLYNIRENNNGITTFDILTENKVYTDFEIPTFGEYNCSNFLAAIVISLKLGLNINEIKKSLMSYQGVERRLEYIFKRQNFVLIDDYAHHPTEIDALRDALQMHFKGKKMIAVFQPHLFSRTRDYINEFADSLSKFDYIYLLPIYPAREEAIEGVSSEWLLKKIKTKNKALIEKNKILEVILTQKPNVFVTIGAGDIGVEVKTLKKQLENEI